MSRGTVPGLATPHPLARLLPAVYQEDDPFVVAFTEGLDEVLAPVLSVLDCLEAYVDPRVAPDDFVDWLSGWVGAGLHEDLPPALRRVAVLRAAALHRLRGTRTGLQSWLELMTGVPVEVHDTGGVTWSPAPGAGPPGPPPSVRVQVGSSQAEVLRRVEELVAAAGPAHVPHRVEGCTT